MCVEKDHGPNFQLVLAITVNNVLFCKEFGIFLENRKKNLFEKMDNWILLGSTKNDFLMLKINHYQGKKGIFIFCYGGKSKSHFFIFIPPKLKKILKTLFKV